MKAMLLIKNGYVMDPAGGTEGKKDILIADGKIRKLTEPMFHPEETRENNQIMD